MLADPRGELRLAAASSEQAGLLELFQLQNDEGPCLECFRTGRPVTAADLTGPTQRWPRFAQAAVRAGFATVEALPMRLRDQVIGALNSRVIIEQAKGKLAERLSIDMDRASTMIRDYARNTNQHLTDVARTFIEGATAEFPPPVPRQQPGQG